MGGVNDRQFAPSAKQSQAARTWDSRWSFEVIIGNEGVYTNWCPKRSSAPYRLEFDKLAGKIFFLTRKR